MCARLAGAVWPRPLSRARPPPTPVCPPSGERVVGLFADRLCLALPALRSGALLHGLWLSRWIRMPSEALAVRITIERPPRGTVLSTATYNYNYQLSTFPLKAGDTY